MSDSFPFHESSSYFELFMKSSSFTLSQNQQFSSFITFSSPSPTSYHPSPTRAPMAHQRENNPHFLPRHEHPHSQPQHNPNSHFPMTPRTRPQPQEGPNLHSPPQQQPPRPSRHQPAQPAPLPQGHAPPRHQTALQMPSPRKTKPLTWFLAVFCALFWIIIIVGGLVILIVYLLFRPRSPKFDISSASLNAAYLDMGYLLNADLTLLANFTNPNKKVKVDFNYMVINVYHESNLIATRYINPFLTMNTGTILASVHMVTSQVPLSMAQSNRLRRQMESNRVRLEIKGKFWTRSSLGSFLKYSYWLYGHCTIVLSGPPSGILLAKECTTKR